MYTEYINDSSNASMDEAKNAIGRIAGNEAKRVKQDPDAENFLSDVKKLVC